MSSDGSSSSSDYEDIDTSDDSESENEDIVESLVANEQWVQLIEYCSVKSQSSDSIRKDIGVQKLCQANDHHFGEKNKTHDSWIIYNSNQEESVIVSFSTSVFINEIHVYESLNPGSIVKLEMLVSHDEKWWTMWQRKSPPKKQSISHNIFKPVLRRYHNQSNTIRVTLDPRYCDKVGIQAIKLVGSNIFDTNLHRKSLEHSMINLYTQALNNINTNVQFSVNDKVVSAHRNILCCRSAYFRSLLLNDFIEKHQTKPIVLSDVSYDAFLEILYFIYTGTYHSTISFEITLESMIYSNKIDLLSAKNTAMEHVCRYLRSHHESVITVYSLAKRLAPAFDILLEYIYDLCSEHLKDIAKQQDFVELDKEYMIDIIYQASERRETREKEKQNQENPLPIAAIHGDDDIFN